MIRTRASAAALSPTSTSRAGPRPRVLVTRTGLDRHDRGSRIVAAWLRDAGMEVIYSASWQRIEEVVELALQEDVDLIGISSLATDPVLVPRLMRGLRAAGFTELPVVIGDMIPPADEALLLDCGIAHIFHPGASREEVVGTLETLLAQAREVPS